jgi:hypothetical protein
MQDVANTSCSHYKQAALRDVAKQLGLESVLSASFNTYSVRGERWLQVEHAILNKAVCSVIGICLELPVAVVCTQ